MQHLHGRPHLKGMGVKLHPVQKYATWLVFSVVGISGVWWSVLHDFMHSEADDLMHNLIVTHGAAAFLAMMLFGALMPQHMRLAWHHKRNRISGGAATAIALLIIVSGFGLYYFDEELRDATKWTHLILGVLSIALMPLHVWFGRRALRQRYIDLSQPARHEGHGNHHLQTNKL